MLSYQELIHIEKVVTKAWLSVETNTDVTRGLGESMVLYQTDGKIRKINVFLNPLHGPVVTKFDKNVPCCILTNWSYFSIYSPISRDQDSKCYEIHPRFLVGFVLLDLQFYVYVLQIVVCPFLLCSFGHCVVCSSSIYGF